MTWRIDDYLAPVTLTAREAAAVIKATPGRFRQLAGSRDEPHPVLGAPTLEAGFRGGKWPLRNVLQFGWSLARELSMPVPPLLPDPLGRARYWPSAYRPRPVTAHLEGGAATAWVAMFEPSETWAAPQRPFTPLLLVTPLWPTTYIGNLRLFASEFATAIGRSLSESEHWVLVEIPVTSREGSHAHEARVDLVTGDELRDPPRSSWSAAWHRSVPFEDLASVLGWPSIPEWPTGTATASTAAMWRPGEPVPVTVPAKWQDLYSASQLAHARADSTPGHLGSSYRTLERECMAAITHDRRHADGRLPRGLEHAVTWQDLELPDPPRNVGFIEAVDHLIDDSTVPASLGDEVLRYFGDWRYTRPTSLRLADAPASWRDRLLAQRRADTDPVRADTARLRRLVHHATVTSPGAIPIVTRGGETLFAWTDDVVTWLAWNGYRDASDDNVDNAWPSDATEALLVRDPQTNHLAAITASPDGTITPLPSTQGPYEFAQLALRHIGRDGAWHSQSLDSLASATTPEQPSALPMPDLLTYLRAAEPWTL